MSNQTNITTPRTYQDFINTGTESMRPQAPATERCGICLDALTSPTKLLLCGHVFDEACLASWFASRSQPTTCPMCRATLFSRDPTSEILAIINGPNFEWQTFDIPEPREAISANFPPPVGNLIQTLLSAPEHVVAKVNLEAVAFCLTRVPNFLLAAAQAQGRILGEREATDFRRIVQAMYIYLSTRGGEEMLAVEMPPQILMGAAEVLESSAMDVDINVVLPESIMELQEDPAERAVQLAFFVTWACLDRSDERGWWVQVSDGVGREG